MIAAQKWTVTKGADGRWMVYSPEMIRNGFQRWAVAIRFAVRMAYGLAVMAHPFARNPRDGRCLVCEEHKECHAMEHSQGDFVEILTSEETATWEKCRIGAQEYEGFYAVYGFDSKGKFFQAARVEPDRVRACEDCPLSTRPYPGLCEGHRRLIAWMRTARRLFQAVVSRQKSKNENPR